jgi:aerobic-type carbon monoxide dehydrogenase small subunit (CoxS/CutS family)
MASEVRIRVNERSWSVNAPPDTPLLYVLSGELKLNGPRFGCGLAQCGSCSVLVDGVETRSCVTPLSAVGNKAVTTLEGLPAWYAQRHKLTQVPALTPVQQAFIDEQAIQCGYCYNGMTIKSNELLSKIPQPSEAQIRTAMNGHLCRCGTYPRILKAIQRAAQATAVEVARERQ